MYGRHYRKRTSPEEADDDDDEQVVVARITHVSRHVQKKRNHLTLDRREDRNQSYPRIAVCSFGALMYAGDHNTLYRQNMMRQMALCQYCKPRLICS